ncbi:hypothetical protein BDV19DRAFT_394873 [Aspergillus venezuelensis]
MVVFNKRGFVGFNAIWDYIRLWLTSNLPVLLLLIQRSWHSAARFTSTFFSSKFQTKQYQEDLDTEKEPREKLHLNEAYNGTLVRTQGIFSGVEIARETLQAQCKEFFAALEQREAPGKRKPSVLWFLHREPTEQKLAREIRAAGELTINQVSSIIMQLESQWKRAHGKTSTEQAHMHSHGLMVKEGDDKLQECMPTARQS